MADTKTVAIERKWPQMDGAERVACIGKMLVTLFTFGFVYPNSLDPFIKERPPGTT